MDNNHCDHAGFSFTKQQLAAVLSTPEGRQLLTLLSRDGGSALSQAAQALKNGDAELAKSLVPCWNPARRRRSLRKSTNRHERIFFRTGHRRDAAGPGADAENLRAGAVSGLFSARRARRFFTARAAGFSAAYAKTGSFAAGRPASGAWRAFAKGGQARPQAGKSFERAQAVFKARAPRKNRPRHAGRQNLASGRRSAARPRSERVDRRDAHV